MNDPALCLDKLNAIVAESSRQDLSLSEKSALYSAARFIIRDFDEYIENNGGNGYAMEKLGQIQWHLGAMLGFDITNGHNHKSHYVWALGALSTFRNVIEEIKD